MVFNIDTADVNKITYTYQHNILEQSQPHAERALVQPLDEASSTLQFKDFIYPGSPATMPALRAMAKTKLSYFMVLGTGQKMGMWYIQRVVETQSVFHDNGQPLKVEFELNLKYHDDLAKVLATTVDYIKGAVEIAGDFARLLIS